ncbi:MAG: hypothetical protein ACYCX4_04275 [Bacillota bacterium]
MPMPGLKQPPLDYPLVQYITLNGRVLFQEENNPVALLLNKPMIMILNTAEDLSQTLLAYSIDPGSINGAVDFKKNLVMVFINIDIVDMKYRTIKITTLGTLVPGLIRIEEIPRSYFYRKEVYFELYDHHGRLVRINRDKFPVRTDLLKRNE